MKNLGLNEIREEFLKFFESKGHLRLPSFSLIPEKDPSLLLINSGMTPLKLYFTGAEEPPRRRVTTCQKCIRTPDIENVGKTARHGTFFEMLGNFSFGDYFKREAISWAWEFFTVVLEIPEEKLYVSIYEDDDEAFEIWTGLIGLPEEKVVRMGKEDNFWEHGIGPCGPCSEIYFDRGLERSCGKPECGVGCDCDRFIEVWNLVFTQFDKKKDGSYVKLDKPNIDTGMGLERLACVLQNVENLFEVDTVKKILDDVCIKAKVLYGDNVKKDISIRVITDHIRSTVMMICDGVIPSNEARGYVLRRLLRRAARHCKLLGIKEMILKDLADTVIEVSGKAYPDLVEKREYIKKIISIEEEKFEITIDSGMNMLTELIDQAVEGSKKISGEVIFKIHDTFGFPFDLTKEILEENGIEVDEEGFKKEMKAQKDKAKEAIKGKNSSWGGAALVLPRECPKTLFTGYDSLSEEAVILYIFTKAGETPLAESGSEVVLVLDRTPFYGESGGQTGDEGTISTPSGLFRVLDTHKISDGKYLHIGVVEEGVIAKGELCKAEVSPLIRKATERNHTATHILQRALKNILGEHINQAGSSVNSDRLRFDFNHFQALTAEELGRIEDEVNRVIYEDLPVVVKEMPIDEAKKLGAMALFGEKYGDIVRVVSVGGYSMEFCGGTHVKNSGYIGMVKIVYEGAVAAGIRRIEAVTGSGAVSYYKSREDVLKNLADSLKSTIPDSQNKLNNLLESYKAIKKELDNLKKDLSSGDIDEMLTHTKQIKGINLLVGRLDLLDAESLREQAETIRSKMVSGVVILLSGRDNRVCLVAMATKDAVNKGIHCGNILKKVAPIVGGGGGGRPDMAQAGGKNPAQIDNCITALPNIVSEMIN
ncbi:MAG: alanine--tRNA ligase [Clostridiales bacterium]|jgi:alanyl-tRNA synthetase|nr:alanine--tRNA ligase [Clostridiales bacterium]